MEIVVRRRCEDADTGVACTAGAPACREHRDPEIIVHVIGCDGVSAGGRGERGIKQLGMRVNDIQLAVAGPAEMCAARIVIDLVASAACAGDWLRTDESTGADIDDDLTGQRAAARAAKEQLKIRTKSQP